MCIVEPGCLREENYWGLVRRDARYLDMAQIAPVGLRTPITIDQIAAIVGVLRPGEKHHVALFMSQRLERAPQFPRLRGPGAGAGPNLLSIAVANLEGVPDSWLYLVLRGDRCSPHLYKVAVAPRFFSSGRSGSVVVDT